MGCHSFFQASETHWTMINVTPAEAQADCHLIEFPDGSKALIDIANAADARGTALTFLQRHKIEHIDLVVISHVHWDHYGCLVDMIKSGITVGRVAINIPASREIADVERPWGCEWEDVQATLQFLRDRHIPYFTPKAGERLMDMSVGGVRVHLDVVCLYDGINTPIGKTDINETSIIVRLSHGATRALFTGDLGNRLGTYLAANNFDVAADLLKAPHHGTEGTAPNEFFARVNPKAIFVPSPKKLWFSLRSKRTRDFFAEHHIPAYVTGIHGHVMVVLTAEDSRFSPSIRVHCSYDLPIQCNLRDKLELRLESDWEALATKAAAPSFSRFPGCRLPPDRCPKISGPRCPI